MTAKEYLKRLKGIDELIETLQQELESSRAMAEACGMKFNATPSFGTNNISDKTSDLAIKINELEEQLKQYVSEYIDKKTVASRIINKMTDTRYQTVLYQYYFKNRTLEGTAGYMNRTYQNICKLHGNALLEFEKLMEEEGITDD